MEKETISLAFGWVLIGWALALVEINPLKFQGMSGIIFKGVLFSRRWLIHVL